MPDNSFDVVSQIEMPEVNNAIQQAMKEITTRYDLKNSKSTIELNEKDKKILLASADVKGFHYDANFVFNEVVDAAIHRAQFGQTLSVSHPLGKKFGVSGEIWHFTQPFLRGNAAGNLWALNYNVRRNLVLDGGFNRGLTGTSTRWEEFVGFTYLLPRRIRW